MRTERTEIEREATREEFNVIFFFSTLSLFAVVVVVVGRRYLCLTM